MYLDDYDTGDDAIPCACTKKGGVLHTEGEPGCQYGRPYNKEEKRAMLVAKVKARGAGIKVGGGVFEAPLCPVEGCDALMVKRHGPRGPFWGCSKWPECDGRPDSGDEDAMEWEAWSELVDW